MAPATTRARSTWLGSSSHVAARSSKLLTLTTAASRRRLHLGGAGVPEAPGLLADSVEAEDGEEHEHAGHERDEGVLADGGDVTLGDHVAPRRQGRLEAE